MFGLSILVFNFVCIPGEPGPTQVHSQEVFILSGNIVFETPKK
jgi:hypothetical protein